VFVPWQAFPALSNVWGISQSLPNWGTFQVLHPGVGDRHFFVLFGQAGEWTGILFSLFSLTLPFYRWATARHHLKLYIHGILKGEVSMYHGPPVWLVRNQLYDNWQFLFKLQNRLIQKSQTGGQWYSDTFPFSFPCYIVWQGLGWTRMKWSPLMVGSGS
jgi:hypothetical protein